MIKNQLLSTRLREPAEFTCLYKFLFDMFKPGVILCHLVYIESEKRDRRRSGGGLRKVNANQETEEIPYLPKALGHFVLINLPYLS